MSTGERRETRGCDPRIRDLSTRRPGPAGARPGRMRLTQSIVLIQGRPRRTCLQSFAPLPLTDQRLVDFICSFLPFVFFQSTNFTPLLSCRPTIHYTPLFPSSDINHQSLLRSHRHSRIQKERLTLVSRPPLHRRLHLANSHQPHLTPRVQQPTSTALRFLSLILDSRRTLRLHLTQPKPLSIKRP